VGPSFSFRVLLRGHHIMSTYPPITARRARAGSVKVFGRLHDDPIHTRRGQAYEKRQGTKSREVGRLRRNALYRGLTGASTLMLADGTSRNEVEGAFKRVMPSPA
jgi:hypothetical protein